MTDPLTGKALVEKSYEYVSRLSKECAKSLSDEFNSKHMKFRPETIASEVSALVLGWFKKRDGGIALRSEIGSSKPGLSYLGFKGSTKDSDFTFTGVISTFSVPGSGGGTSSFVKSLSFSVDKTSFEKRKL